MGLWLGEAGASEHLMLEFQPLTTLPDSEMIFGWMHSLETFMGNNMSEIGTIFDKLPLDMVIFLPQACAF